MGGTNNPGVVVGVAQRGIAASAAPAVITPIQYSMPAFLAPSSYFLSSLEFLTSSGLVQWSNSLHVSPPSPSVTCAQDGTNAGSAGSQLTGHGDSPLIFLRLEATKVLFEMLL